MRTTAGTGSGVGTGYVRGLHRAPVSRSSLTTELGLMAVVVIWGLNFALIKVPLEVAPPFVVNVLRFTVSVAVLGVLHVSQARQLGRSPFATFEIGGWRVVGISLLGVTIYQAGFILGVGRVTAGMAALLVASSPVWTALSSHALGIDRLRPLGWVGVALGIGGVALVTLGRPEAHLGGDTLGVALMLLASLAWGLYTTFSRPLLDRGASPLGLTFWSVLLSFPVLILLALPELAVTPWSRLGAAEWGAIVFSGGLSTGVAYGIWNSAIRAAGPSQTAAFSNLVPFVGLGAGALILHEPVRALQVAGGALIVAGVVVARRLG